MQWLLDIHSEDFVKDFSNVFPQIQRIQVIEESGKLVTVHHETVQRKSAGDFAIQGVFATINAGSFMSPILRKHDILIISKVARPVSGDICLVSVEPYHYLLREVRLEKDIVRLFEDNPEIPPATYPTSQLLSIWPVVGVYVSADGIGGMRTSIYQRSLLVHHERIYDRLLNGDAISKTDPEIKAIQRINTAMTIDAVLR